MTCRELCTIPHRHETRVLPLFDALDRVGSGFWLGYTERVGKACEQALEEWEDGIYVSYIRGR